MYIDAADEFPEENDSLGNDSIKILPEFGMPSGNIYKD